MSESFWMDLYERFQKMDKTRKNLLRRAVHPDDLIENPVFYELYNMDNKTNRQRNQVLRMVFCLPYIRHADNGQNLGSVFARMEKNRPIVSEKRMIQLNRTEENDRAMEQLRRLLKQAQNEKEKAVVVDWNKMGRQLVFWNENVRRDILEDYFLALKKSNK